MNKDQERREHDKRQALAGQTPRHRATWNELTTGQSALPPEDQVPEAETFWGDQHGRFQRSAKQPLSGVSGFWGWVKEHLGGARSGRSTSRWPDAPR